MHPVSAVEPDVHAGRPVVEAPPAGRHKASGQGTDLELAGEGHRNLFRTVPPVNPDRVRAVDEDVRHGGIPRECLQRPQPGKFGADAVHRGQGTRGAE